MKKIIIKRIFKDKSDILRWNYKRSLRVYAYMSIYAFLYVHTSITISTYVYTYTHIRVYLYAHTRILICTYAYIYTRIMHIFWLTYI